MLTFDERPTAASGTEVSLEARARILKQVGERVAQLRSRYGRAANPIRDVVLVVSSSRSGSSCFVEMLKRSPQFLHFPGELSPFMRIAGLAWPDTESDCDQIDPSALSSTAAATLALHFAAEVGRPDYRDFSSGDETLIEDLCVRLHLQWPLESFTLAEVHAAVSAAIASGSAAAATEQAVQRFHAYFLRSIAAQHPAVNPHYYDIDRSIIAQVCPHVAVPTGPPSSVIIEEPPFILTRPWARPAGHSNQTLILKTPSDAYRIDMLRALFPGARFRLVHLTRNPAASINGIRDGWLHHGFHSNFVGEILQVPGYSTAGLPDSGWWKFDLPPGWREQSQASLEQICAFQWRSAHESILSARAGLALDSMRLRFEDLLAGTEIRTRVLGDLFEWLGVPASQARGVDCPPSPVMATHAPRLGRWREHMALLEPVYQQASIRALCHVLDYENQAEWV